MFVTQTETGTAQIARIAFQSQLVQILGIEIKIAIQALFFEFCRPLNRLKYGRGFGDFKPSGSDCYS